MGAWKKRSSDDPTSTSPTASPLVSGRRRCPHSRRPRHGGVDGTDRRIVIASHPCPCLCHPGPDGVTLDWGHDCTPCDNTGRVIVGGAVIDAIREVDAEAAKEAVPDTFRQARIVDPGTPPCCSTPQLCGGPHEDCDAAPGGEAATGTVADDSASCCNYTACSGPPCQFT